MTELIEVPAGLAGVAVSDTEIGDVLGDRGYFHYRGRSAPELAREHDFETAAAWLLAEQEEPLELDRRLPDDVANLAASLDVRSALSAAGVAFGFGPLHDLDPDARLTDARRIIATMPTLIASSCHGRPVAPDPVAGHSTDALAMLTGTPPSPEAAAAMRVYHVLTLDHGFNTSTFAARVVASTGADLMACVLAGYGSLSGPRHGANVERTVELLERIGTPDDAPAFLRAELQQGRLLHGFGHAVYRRADPRLVLLRDHAAVVAPELHAIALAVERAGTELLAGRRLVPNVDLYAGVVLEGCGVPRGWFTPVFATARVVGWCAHAIEQVTERRTMRPAARYVGPPPDGDVY